MNNEITAVIETAKATQEVAKTTGKALDAATSLAGFFNEIFGEPIKNTVGLLWTDRVVAKRLEASIYSWERAEELFLNAKLRLQEKGVTELKAIPPKIALPLLENATIENEESLQTLWANLLATSLDANQSEIERKYINTLSEMSGLDAEVFADMIVESNKDSSKESVSDSGVVYGPCIDGTLSHDPISVILLNRLGLIEPSQIEFMTYTPGGYHERYGEYEARQDKVSLPGDLSTVNLTYFGRRFAAAIGIDEIDAYEK